jgi:hypothetical protein
MENPDTPDVPYDTDNLTDLLVRLKATEDLLKTSEARKAALRERITALLPTMPGWLDTGTFRTSAGIVTQIKGSETAKYDTKALDVLCNADPDLGAKLARYRTVSVRPATWKLDRRALPGEDLTA